VRVINIVETPLNAGVKNPNSVQLIDRNKNPVDGVIVAPARAEAIRCIFKSLFPLWFQCVFDNILPNSILDGWNT
ncbi:MAG TPA: hypothetical protein V6D48_11240, partial [Oculatellaceae cyanobacterium]